ncbi:hypothetical protein [Filifactor alocis]|uniref:hypothetical protein n=1 Tax=Filifactor alocis TaxID=143361 RepID=UPI0028D2E000|nr:hypothetical protein [Filifactor alocis]
MENQILEELKKLNSRFDNLEEDLRGFKQEVSDKFDAMDQRFNAMDQRLDSMDQRFDAIDQRLDSMDQRFDAIDQRLDSIEKYSRDAVDILIELSKRTVSIEQYQKLKKQVDLNTKDIHELRLKIG